MPNWCNCTLAVDGPKTDLDKWRTAVAAHFKTINKDINGELTEDEFPFTFDYDVRNSELPEEDWYNDNIARWGTKWDAADVVDCDYVDNDDHSMLTIHFDTAWSPPIPWAEAASKNNPTLTFELEYGEPGCDFAGAIEYKNGEIIFQEESTYNEKYPTCTECGDIQDSLSDLIQVDDGAICSLCNDHRVTKQLKEQKKREKEEARMAKINNHGPIRDGAEEIARKLTCK